MYKIYTNSLCWLNSRVTKFLLIMKLTIVLLIVSLTQVSAVTYAQQVSLNKKEVTLKQIFKEIKKQTGHDVLYQPNKLNANQKITANFHNSSLDEVMKACLKGMPLGYTFYENSIVIKEGTPAVNIQATALMQPITVKGRVVDTTGLPLPGATIRVKGTKLSTVADVNGLFTLNGVEEGATLQISFISFLTQEVKAAANITIKLKSLPLGLNEVVVSGTYGTVNAATERAISTVVTVSGKSTEDKPGANALDALQGRVPGLSILSNGGEPSQQPSIRLHGLGSLFAGTDPYVILDGSPIDLATVLTINADDILDWKILKDAASLSIYGSQASNGVIIINTKRGSYNKPSAITFSSQFSYSSIADLKFFKQFMNRDELINFDLSSGLQTQAQLDKALAAIPVKNADTKWYKYYYKSNTPAQKYDLSITGGGGKTTYYISGGYLTSTGIAAGSGYERYNMRSNLTSQVNKWIQVGLNFSLVYDITHTNPYTANSTNGGLSMFAAPYISPYQPDGTPYPTVIPGWGGRRNPFYNVSENPVNNDKLTINPTAYIQLKPITGLTLKSQAGVNAYDYTVSNIVKPSYLGVGSALGTNTQNYERNARKTFTNTAEYAFTVGGINHITALAGQEYSDGDDSGFSAHGEGLTDDRLLLLGNTNPDPRNIGSFHQEYVYNSFFGKLDYNFNEKYYATASIRNDESSKFSPGHLRATFWSGGLAWEAKKENFLKDVSWIDNLTLKANAGTSGNSEIGNYASPALVSPNAQYNGAKGYNVTNPGSPNLTWEQHLKSTFGINVSVLDRFHLDLSYYIDKGTNELAPVPYPETAVPPNSATIFPYGILTNAVTLVNSGFDIDFSVDLWKDRAHNGYLNFFLKTEITHNKITKLFQGRNNFPLPDYLLSWSVGQPVNYFLPLWAGVNPQTGAPQWYLPGPDPSVTRKDPKAVTSDYNSDALQQNAGISQYAPSQGSFGINAGYKGFELQAMFYYALGKHLINNDGYYFQNANVYPVGFNAFKDVQGYWKKPGDVARFPDINNYQMTQFDSSLLENASFMRLKDLTLSYTVPDALLTHTKVIKGLKFFVEGRNLFTITKYTGPDPEIDSNLSYGEYPDTKQYSFGVRATL